MTTINSRNNKKIKLVRSLRSSKARKSYQLFIVEGIRHVGEALDSGAEIDSIFYAPGLLKSEYASTRIERAAAEGVTVYQTSEDIFRTIADKDNPQGVLAIVHQKHDSLDQYTPENFQWGVAVIDPQDPGNIGTLIRTIDAVGANGLILIDGGTDPYHHTSARSSMGAIFWHPIITSTFGEFSAWTRRHSYHVYGTSAHAAASYKEINRYKSPRILLLGSEQHGITAEQAKICETMLHLPMRGKVSSLNLGVAAGILLYQMLD